MAVLILAKHDNASLNDATAKTVTAAKAMGGDITVLVDSVTSGLPSPNGASRSSS